MMRWRVVICDDDVVAELGAVPSASLRSIPSRWPRRRDRAGRTQSDAMVEAVTGARAQAVVLARSETAGDRLGAIARASDVDVIRLPDDPARAAWSVSLAAALCAVERDAALRVLEVLCAGPEIVRGAPTRGWGRSEIAVPALRPVTLARWASRAWRPCGWCRRGGAPGAACRRCGAPVPVSTDVAS